ncbi:ASST-domain-containing protein [Colletotrichum navitas]|uniref:ASST-domain-containing protein n=1 Tax=Colletotrichum navitas TaxID=681940 RepID=A0AAD8PSN0_9PEZI|nr:ASST-domain-containing protein [Colletotrichum navitas]KAK1579359.1 ASST-domain-containing protein [Colletotrichum navitas]
MTSATCNLVDTSRPFKSRPDIVIPHLNVTLHNPSLVNPGFYFLAPFKSYVSTPMIFDSKGELVWAGSDAYAGTEGAGAHVYDFHTCDFQGLPHLCMLRGFNDQGNARGQGIILDSHYQPVKHVSGGGHTTSCDLHEFTTAESGTTSLITQYRRRLYDLSGHVESRGMIWILEGVFQEIEIDSGRVLFEWRSLDHIDPAESQVQPGQGTRTAPWDYVHLNSVEKMPDGNYLVSARHTSTIFKVSSRDGSIIWRLGGSNSTFGPIEPAILFQHHARVLVDDADTTRISLFDNARRPAFKPERPSSGLIVLLDHRTKTAHIEKRYSGPGIEYTSKIAGSTLVLPNGNVLVGFGDAACFTEYTSDGIPGFKACVRDNSLGTLYRVYKSSWVGAPLNTVALVSFSQTPASLTAFHVSWNGATEVKSWRVYGALHPDGPFSQITQVPKKGFETTITTEDHYVKAYVEAISSTDKVLGKSDVVTTFVPSKAAGIRCDDIWCAEPLHCLVPGRVTTTTAATKTSHPKLLQVADGLQHIPFFQALLLNFVVTLILVISVGLVRKRTAFKRCLGRIF